MECVMAFINEMKMIERVREAEQCLLGTKYDSEVAQLIGFYLSGDMEGVEAQLIMLPTKEELLNDLVDKLIHCKKSISRTLKHIQEDYKLVDQTMLLKGLFSLGVHAVIEIEKGSGEYRMVLPLIHQKIGALLCRSE